MLPPACSRAPGERSLDARAGPESVDEPVAASDPTADGMPPTLEHVLGRLTAMGVPAQTWLSYAATRFGPGWKLNPQGAAAGVRRAGALPERSEGLRGQGQRRTAAGGAVSAPERPPGGTGAQRAEVPRVPDGRPRAHGSHRQAHRLRVAHLSDLHYGPRHLEEADRCFSAAVDRAIELAVDAAVISGDATDHALDLHAPAARLLAQVRRWPTIARC